MNNETKKVLGGIGGGAGGASAGFHAGLVLAAAFPPLAPLSIIGGTVAGAIFGAKVGHANPSAGAVSVIGLMAGIPLPPTGGSGGSSGPSA